MKKINKNKKLYLLAAILVLLVGSVLAYYLINVSSNDGVSNTGQGQQLNPQGINLNPPTESDKSDAEARKTTLSNENTSPTQPTSNGKKSVSPIITYSGEYNENIEVGARVPGILEEKGTCTLTLSKDGKSVSQSKDAVPNVSEMSCGVIKIAKSKLTKGTWSGKVFYSSTKAEGSSDIFKVDVN